MNAIEKIQASINALHGGTREQRAKYDSLTAWQVRQRMSTNGREAPSCLKQSVDDPHDPQEKA